MKNWQQTVIHQYANSPVMQALISTFNDCIDPTVDFNAFIKTFWDINTCGTAGLDFWGKVVGVQRGIVIPKKIKYLGFYKGAKNFFNGTFQPRTVRKRYIGFAPNAANFFNGTFAPPDFQQITQNEYVGQSYNLNDAQYRVLIQAKALANISNTSSYAINKILNIIFAGRGKCWVQDWGGMAVLYHFEFTMLDWEKALVTQSGVLPNTTGVRRYALFGKNRGFLGFAPISYAPFPPSGVTVKKSIQNFYKGNFFSQNTIERIV